MGQRRRVFVNSIIVGIVTISFCDALVVGPDGLGFVNVVDGALCVGVFSSLSPALVGVFLLEQKSFLWRSSLILLVIVGLIMSGLGFVYTENYEQDLEKYCKWLANF